MRQAETAAAVYHEDIVPTLHGRQLFVRQQLEAFIETYTETPTSSELLRFICAQFPHRSFDPNSVRPRLTEMHEQGWVRHADKRRCAVTGKRVFTWACATPRPPTSTDLHQAGLFR